jgi:ABC-type nitrate/sulfonate/bicarbonate transport system substrate-binding protein
VTPPATSLVVGTFSPSVVLRVARRTGILHRHGLEVREEAVPSSPAQFQALSDGSLDAALTSPDNVVAYRFLEHNPLGGRRDVRIVSAVDRGLGLALYAAPGTRAAVDLRGAVVGVDVAASGFAFALLEILGREGLARDRDYTLVELGSTPQRLQALLDSRCAATMLNAGNDLKADDAGFVRLVDVSEVAEPYLGTVLAVQGEPAPAVRALADALREASAAVLDGSARDAAREEAERTGLPPHLAARYVERLLDPDRGLVPDGAVDRAALDSVVELRRRHLPDRSTGTTPYGDELDALATATDPGSGLVDAGSTA